MQSPETIKTNNTSLYIFFEVFGYRVIIKNDIVLFVVPKLKITPIQIIKILNWLYDEGFIDSPNKEVLVKDNIKNYKINS